MPRTTNSARSDIRQKDLDRTIIAAKKQIESAYATALARYAKLKNADIDSPEYRRIDAEIQAQYRQSVSEAIERLENEMRDRTAADFALATRDLPSRRESSGEWAEKYRQNKTLSARTESQIRHSATRLSREAELLARLLADAPEPLGEIRRGKLSSGQMKRLSALMKDPLAVRRAAGMDMAQWRRTVYGTDSPADAASLLGRAVERELVKDHYVLQNTLGREVPEILGYRISVRPVTRRGAPRKTDICDRFAGDYSPDFVFTGWHYNCRCRCQPIIPAALLTAELRAKGFVGIPGHTRIERMPQGISRSLSASRQQYEQAFPELVEANFVEYRGQKRLLADLSRQEQLEYYLNRFKGDFLQDVREIRVSLTAPSDPEVLMDTRTEGDRVHFQLSTLKARDGHIPGDDLLEAFKKSGTGVTLSRAQLSAASDITHEMVHTLSRDYSFAQMEQMYPQWRDELLEFNLNPSSYQRLSLEMLTEWHAREIFPQVARQQGWSLPANYRAHIGTGYTGQVANLETFLRYVPDPADFRRRLEDILRRGDKAMAYRFLTQTIRESKTLRNARSAETALKKMLDEPDAGTFEQYMDKNARNPPAAASGSALNETAQGGKTIAALREAEKVKQAMKKAGAATTGAKAAETIKKLGSGLDLHRDAMIPVRAASLTRALRYIGRPATLLAPIGVANELYNQSQTPSESAADTLPPGLPQRRHYLHPDTYRGRGYAAALTAGVADAAVELIAWPIKTILGIGEYAYRGMAKGLSLQPMPDGAFKDKLREIGAKFDATNRMANDFVLEAAEFFYLYQTDQNFRLAFDLQMSLEVRQYLQAIKGTGEAQGYEQGRMIGDIITLLISIGGLKKLLQQWKRLHTLNLKALLPKEPAALPAPQSPRQLPASPQRLLLPPAAPQGAKQLTDGASAAVSANAPKALPPATTLIENAADREAYEKYLKRKAREGKTPREFDDWKQQSDYMRNQSPLARGRRFDQKAKNEKWYDYHQIHLANGKRLDSYKPETGQIVSRKSIDLSKISIYTFEQHLKELVSKYRVGTIIRSNTYPRLDGKVLQGKYYLEVPDYNKDLPELEKFINLARKYNVEIIFKPE